MLSHIPLRAAAAAAFSASAAAFTLPTVSSPINPARHRGRCTPSWSYLPAASSPGAACGPGCRGRRCGGFPFRRACPWFGPPAAGVDRQAVDAAPPAVERADDRADQPALDFGYEYDGWAIPDDPPQVISGVRDSGRGVGLPPEFKDHYYTFQPALTDQQSIRCLLGPLRLQQTKKARSRRNLPRASSCPDQ